MSTMAPPPPMNSTASRLPAAKTFGQGAGKYDTKEATKPTKKDNKKVDPVSVHNKCKYYGEYYGE